MNENAEHHRMLESALPNYRTNQYYYIILNLIYTCIITNIIILNCAKINARYVFASFELKFRERN